MVVLIVVSGMIFALLASIVQLYLEYRRDVEAIYANLDFIENSYLPAITTSSYLVDNEQLKIQLRGALQFPGIEFLQVTEERGGDSYRIELGSPEVAHPISKEYNLQYHRSAGEKIHVGTMLVKASLTQTYNRLRERSVIILFAYGTGFMLMALFILLIIEFSVARHIGKMANFTKSLDVDDLDQKLALDRRSDKMWRPDELDHLAGTINDLRIRLKEDITERRQTEERLRRSEAKYRDLVENINDVIYSTDENGHITYISPAVKKVLGYDQSEIIGSHFSKFIHPDDLAYLIDQFTNIPAGNLKPDEYRILAKSGKYHWIRSSSKPILEAGKAVGLSGMFTDVTERKQLESELIQSHKMESIGTMAGGIAHDFNNILSAVIGYTELALSSVKKGSLLFDYLQEVFVAGGRAKELVQQILTFSRQAERKRKLVQVKRIVQEALKFLRASLPSTIEIRKDIRHNSLVMADPTQIHQMVMNLCTNAGYAMREKGGVLSVTLAETKIESDSMSENPELKPGVYLELTVSDTGDGISPQIMDRIFDPFFTTKEKGEGTGMGLSVVHGIVGSCEGAIAVSSRLGLGTSFKIYLPVVESQLDARAGIEQPLPIGSEHILFVDDEPALVDIGKLTLESLGYKVTSRTESLEALKLFKADPDKFDLVITDMTMPNMAGDDLAKELIRIKPEIPVILCTGYSSRINPEKAAAMGIRAFISKPVLRKDIAQTIRKVLGK